MMMKCVILLIALGVGFGAAAWIPYDNEPRPASLTRPELPKKFSGWTGEALAPSPQEEALLAEDTEILKRQYYIFEPSNLLERWESVLVSLVLSGNDLNGSIHRPERCLVSQGHQDLAVTTVTVPVGKGRTIRVNRIHSKRPIFVEDKETPTLMDCVSYYWFVGHGRLTEDHLDRTLMDMRDRLMGGYVQQWAYFLITSDVTDSVSEIGRSMQRTDATLLTFVREVFNACVTEEAFGK